MAGSAQALAGVTPQYLPQLTNLATMMLGRGGVAATIRRLRAELKDSPETFVWAPLGLRAVDENLPAEIQSAWLFALKADTWSGAHFHPNSIQHMLVVEGRGRSRIDGREAELGDGWCVIDAGIVHEFLPEGDDLIVMSFHTAKPEELMEVSADSREKRHYA